jgi:outer membrane cobalamin receptor
LYPRGSVHVGLNRHVGVFAKYRPYVRLPTFRELYYETDYSAAADYIPFTEVYGAFEIGVVNNVYDSLQTELSFYEKRFRNDYTRENVPGDFKTTYHDLGKYYNRGLSARAQLNFRRYVSIYGRYVYDRFEIIDVRGGHIPYRPSNTFTTGFLVGEETGYNVTAELKRVGERFGDSAGTIILPPAVIADAGLRLRLRRGISVYVKGENLNDATYNVIYGVPAPGRTISAGLKLVI